MRQASEAGIPGIKYLDQGSRAGGEGTRNFVIFSDKDVEIVKPDGTSAPPPAVPPTPAAPAQPPQSNAVKAVLSRVSVGGKDARKYTWNDFYRDWVDRLDPLNEAVKAMADGRELSVVEDAYKQARLLVGVAGKANHFLKYSPFEFKTYKNVGRSLEDIMNKDVEGKPRDVNLDELRAYVVAKRSIEKESQGVKTGVPQAEAQQVVAELGPKYERIHRELVEYQDHLVNYLRESGLVSPDMQTAMKGANQEYTPFYRLMEEDTRQPGTGGKKIKGRQPIKKMTGSERQIIDPLESIIRNTYVYTALAEKNAVAESFVKLAETSPNGADYATKSKTKVHPTKVQADEIRKFMKEHGLDPSKIPDDELTIFRPNAVRPGPDQIVVYRDGKPQLWDVQPEVADTFNAVNHEQAGLITKILATPARLLRAGAILSPEFVARNPIRDQFSAFIFSENHFKPFLDLARGIYSLARKDKDYQNWLKSGGPQATLVSLDRTYLQKNIRDLAHKTSFMDAARNVVGSPIEMLRIASEFSEQGTRIGEFKAEMKGRSGKAAIQEGGFASREVSLDFGRMGAKGQSVNMLVAFFNAWVQGQDKAVRAFRDHPVATTAKVAASITVPSILLFLHNRKDPDYWRLPQWQRDLFWVFSTGEGKDKTWWRIPKPFEIGLIFGTGPERIMQAILENDDHAFDHLGESLKSVLLPNIVPTAALPIIETYANRSLFTDRAIIPAGREDLLPEYQYREYTSELSKSLGHLVASIPGMKTSEYASPAVIDTFVNDWSGGLGRHIVNIADAGLRKAGVLPDPVLPAKTLADIPFVKAFVVRHPSGGAQPIVDFYDHYAEQQQVVNTIKRLARDGDIESARKELAISQASLVEIGSIKDALSNSMKFIHAIEKNPEMTPDDKRQLIDDTYRTMIAVAEHGNAQIDAVRKSIGQTK